MRIVKLIERRCKISAAYLYVFEVSFRCIAIGGIECECVGVSYSRCASRTRISGIESECVGISYARDPLPYLYRGIESECSWNPPRLIAPGTRISGIESGYLLSSFFFVPTVHVFWHHISKFW